MRSSKNRRDTFPLSGIPGGGPAGAWACRHDGVTLTAVSHYRIDRPTAGGRPGNSHEGVIELLTRY